MITRLPPRRTRPKSGIEKAPQRIWPKHRAFVRRHRCVVPDCQDGPIDFAHVKSRGAGGHDCFGVSLCRIHHTEQHATGVATFGKKYGIDLWALAREFLRRSTDREMKESLKLNPEGTSC